MEQDRQHLLKRLKILVEQFTTENRIYEKTFIYKGQNILQMINDELVKLGVEVDPIEDQEFKESKNKEVLMP